MQFEKITDNIHHDGLELKVQLYNRGPKQTQMLKKLCNIHPSHVLVLE